MKQKEELTIQRTAIILALELMIALFLSALYDMTLEISEQEITNKPNIEVETQASSLPNTEILGEGSEIGGTIETETVLEPSLPNEPEAIVLNENPLTGLYDVTDAGVGKRPVAVMINNVSKSMPQYGIAQADIIFEIPVEGFLTRFMAIYADYTQMPKICSIRSCRPYFPAIAKGFDAVYVYSGMSSDIRDYVNSLELAVFEGGRNHGGLFGRDQERKDAGYKLEHTMYFDGTGIVQAMKKRKIRSDIESDNRGKAFLFHETMELVRPEGESCRWIEIDFGAATATFTYDIDTNTYKKDFNGKPQVDGVVGSQLSFTNVFVLETTIKMADNGVHKDVDWHGGKGYYISNGVMQEITWSKKSEEAPLLFFDKEGNKLEINRGKSYIAINRKNRTEFKAAITDDTIR